MLAIMSATQNQRKNQHNQHKKCNVPA